jgi:membrane-associated phospholipid phosphatase
VAALCPRFSALALVLAAIVLAPAARADGSADRGLRYDTGVDVSVSLGATAFILGTGALKAWLGPTSCRLCDRHADGSDALNPLDSAARRAFRWSDTSAANQASDLTGFALAPAASLGLCEAAAAADNRSREAPANALVVVETVALAGSANQIVKFVAARQRPFAHFRGPAGARPRDPDENLSFYSGHTSLDFSLAVASGTVASMRGYRLAPAVWATSLPIAVLTGYLRIAADKHYFTDVAVGAVLGAAIGAFVPLAFHAVPASSAPGELSARRAQPQASIPLFAGSWTF